MAVLGLRGSGSFNVGGAYVEEPTNFREGILWIHPNPAPLTAFTSRLDSEVTTDAQYNWFEEQTPSQRAQVSAAYASGATSIVLATVGVSGLDPDIFKAGHVIQDQQTGEQMYVTGYNAATHTLTVTRGFGNAAAAIGATDTLSIIGTSHPEGDVAATPLSFQPGLFSNYTQIFKDSFSLTRTALNTRYRTGDAYQQDKIRTLRNHAIQMEKAFIWGIKTLTTGANGQPQRTTSGIVNFIQTNVTDFGGTVTEVAWDAALERFFRYGSDEKLCLMGGIALNTLNGLTKNKATLNVVPLDQTFGYRLYEYGTPNGTLYLYRHPLMSMDPTFMAYGVVIDLPRIRYRYITQTTLEQNVQQQGMDARQDQFLTECGLEVHHEYTHAVLKNMSAAA
jgi:uncharacterized protein DUF5309